MQPEIEERRNIYVMDIIKEIENEINEIKEWPKFGAGDTLVVTYKIKEGDKERLQSFQGVVLQRRGEGVNETFTIRKMSGSIGVERIFPSSSPFIEKIDINKRGHVRRARIFYLRGLTGKAARIAEKTDGFSGKVSQEEKKAAREAKANRDEASNKKGGKKKSAEQEATTEE